MPEHREKSPWTDKTRTRGVKGKETAVLGTNQAEEL